MVKEKQMDNNTVQIIAACALIAVITIGMLIFMYHMTKTHDTKKGEKDGE